MNRSILIAHGDVRTADALRPCCIDRGYQTTIVNGGLECLSALRYFRPDLILLDHYLPWGGAAGVLARMREELDFSWSPVVLVCNQTTHISSDHLRPPVVYVLRMPFSESALDECLQAATVMGEQPQYARKLLSAKFESRSDTPRNAGSKGG